MGRKASRGEGGGVRWIGKREGEGTGRLNRLLRGEGDGVSPVTEL